MWLIEVLEDYLSVWQETVLSLWGFGRSLLCQDRLEVLFFFIEQIYQLETRDLTPSTYDT